MNRTATKPAMRFGSTLAWTATLVAGLACDPAPAAPKDSVTPFSPLVEVSPIGPLPDFEGPAASFVIEKRDTFSSAALRSGWTLLEVNELVVALRDRLDFRRVRTGQSFTFLRGKDGRLSWVKIVLGTRDIVHAFRDKTGTFFSAAEPVRVTTRIETVDGEIQDSLYMAMDAAGESPALTMMMVDLFSWDVDFYTETQRGDRFFIVVEKEFIGRSFQGYRRILGAEYKMAKGRVARALLYQREDEAFGYYTPDGTSVKKAFLKSPIQFASITSRYGMRLHPILKYAREHRGVDYGAPVGTAVWAVADGVVRSMGSQNGYGKVVMLRHANGLETRYAHLSAFPHGLRAGQRVQQKQVIGFVGKTGLATGPHLHFEVLQAGRFTNPLKMVVPPAPPIPSDEMPRFREATANVLATLREASDSLAYRSVSP